MLEARDTAQAICRGVTRALTQRGFATLAEVSSRRWHDARMSWRSGATARW